MTGLKAKMRQFYQTVRSPDFEIPFLVFLTVVLVGVSFFGIRQVWLSGDLVKAWLMVLLGLISILLHWIAPLIYIENRKRNVYGYILIQASLAAALTLLSEDIDLPMTGFAYFLSLIGEVYGAVKSRIEKLWIAMFLLLVSLFSWWIYSGTWDILTWALGMLPATAFIMIYITLYDQQATAKEEAQALLVDLRRANRALERSARDIESLTLMAERQRMARELHDTLAQGLAGIILQMEAADSYLEKSDMRKAQSIIQQAMIRARQALSESRQVIDNLRKKSYDPEAFVEWMEKETARFAKETDIPCHLDVDLPLHMPVDMQLAIQRILGEGLMNIKKHARATQARLSVKEQKAAIEVRIADNGRGFLVGEISEDQGRYGLLGIEERAAELGGEFVIETEPGEGTILIVCLPSGHALQEA